jgi:PAS domain S-box-containing protein
MSRLSQEDFSACFKALSQLTSDVVWVVDAKTGAVAYVNAAVEVLLGSSQSAFIGKHIAESVVAEDAGVVQDMLAADCAELASEVAQLTLRRLHTGQKRAVTLQSHWCCKVKCDVLLPQMKSYRGACTHAEAITICCLLACSWTPVVCQHGMS